ncbi:MAG TPA: glycosyl transferase, partial [Gammaproteobacteria bacterium]|nr:glycosyl transferase [Gammaproteobacteria bacterium]
MKVKHSPLVTIVTISLNCKSSLEETISSVCSQDYSRIEYIIVDGGSTDGSLSIIDSYNWCVDKTISEKDDGIYSAMNKGLKMASKNSDFITFLNAGDIFHTKFVIREMVCESSKTTEHLYG